MAETNDPILWDVEDDVALIRVDRAELRRWMQAMSIDRGHGHGVVPEHYVSELRDGPAAFIDAVIQHKVVEPLKAILDSDREAAGLAWDFDPDADPWEE